MTEYIDNIASCHNDRQQQELSWRKTWNSHTLQHSPRVVALVLVDGKLASTLDDSTQQQPEPTKPRPDPIFDAPLVNEIEEDPSVNAPEPTQPAPPLLGLNEYTMIVSAVLVALVVYIIVDRSRHPQSMRMQR